MTQLPAPLPTKLNLGCGYDIREGYLNVDLHEWHNPDLIADITDLSVLPSNHFDELVAQDVLEHLERHKTVPALKEWSRLLKPGGVVHIRVPSLFDLFVFLSAPEWRRDIERTEEVIHLMYGTQAYTGDYHLAGFTARILSEYLSLAGLAVCKARLHHSWLYEISARKTDRLTDPLEIAYNVCFKVLDRVADEGALAYISAEVAAGRLDQAGADRLLRESKEAMFLAANPVYVRNTPHPLQEQLQVALAERDAALAQVAALQNSTSWKLTSPLRILSGAIRRR
jgi:predicted SAM-dependent methyltransferase